LDDVLSKGALLSHALQLGSQRLLQFQIDLAVGSNFAGTGTGQSESGGRSEELLHEVLLHVQVQRDSTRTTADRINIRLVIGFGGFAFDSNGPTGCG